MANGSTVFWTSDVRPGGTGPPTRAGISLSGPAAGLRGRWW